LASQKKEKKAFSSQTKEKDYLIGRKGVYKSREGGFFQKGWPSKDEDSSRRKEKKDILYFLKGGGRKGGNILSKGFIFSHRPTLRERGRGF